MALFVILGVSAVLAQPPPLPTAAQTVALRHNFSIFMHYSLCTYTPACDGTWDIPPGDPNNFFPDDLYDPDQWLQTAALAGATQVCLTVRHVDGFALWPTKSNNYSISASRWRNGTGDIVADFVASARKYNISPCFYIILGFNVWANYSGVPGPEYLAQQVTALTELLSNYGHIDRLWWYVSVRCAYDHETVSAMFRLQGQLRPQRGSVPARDSRRVCVPQQCV